MKRFLYLSYFFPPIQSVESIVALNAVKYAPGLGWEPVVIAAASSSTNGMDPDLAANVPVSFSVTRTPSWENIVTRGLTYLGLFPDCTFGWFPSAFRAARAAARAGGIDAIVSRANPITSHLIAYTLRRTLHVPWIALFGDPWTRNPYIRYRNPLIRRYHEAIERRILRSADRIVVTTDRAIPMLAGDADLAAKTVVIPNTYDPEEFNGINDARPAGGPFTLSYIGTLYGLRSPEPFFAALALFFSRRDGAAAKTVVNIVGSLGTFGNLLARYGVEKQVAVRGFLRRKESITAMKEADVLVLIDAPTAAGAQSVFLPAKLVEYANAGPPILGITPEGVSADLIRRTKTGVVVSPGDVEGIATAIMRYYDAWEAGTLAIRPLRAEVERYSAHAYARALTGILNRLTA